MTSDILHNLNEILLHNFPGKSKAVSDTITSGESRFHNQADVLSPEFDLEKAKFILGYPEHLQGNTLSDRLDKLLWEHYDIFKHIDSPDLKANMDYSLIFPLLDLFSME